MTATYTQRPHEVVRMIPETALARLPRAQAVQLLRQREQVIAEMAEDPFRCGYEPPIWRETDLWVARTRLQYPGAVIELLLLGGIQSGKTDFVSKRGMQHLLLYKPEQPVQPGKFRTWACFMAPTEPFSKTINQSRDYYYLPKEYHNSKGKEKRTRTTSLGYSEGKGFTDNMFVIDSRLCVFKFYEQKEQTNQGAQFTFANEDEIVPFSVHKDVTERLSTRAKESAEPENLAVVRQIVTDLEAGRTITGAQAAVLYMGVQTTSFTPKDGWTDTVGEFLTDATLIRDEEARLLPVRGPGGKITGYKRLPRVRRGKVPTRLILNYWSEDNPYGNYAGRVAALTGTETEIKIAFYGDVESSVQRVFGKYRAAVHDVDLSQIPRNGTFYHIVDPATARNWYMQWWLVAADERHYLVWEWPQAGDYIPGFGDRGDWAVSSHGGKIKYDGAPGPAQENDMCFGYLDYWREIDRVEHLLGAWYKGGELEPWELSEEAQRKHGPIDVWQRHMDSRLGNTPTPTQDGSTTIIKEMEFLKDPQGKDCSLIFDPAPAENLKEGDSQIKDLLAYKDELPIGPMNSPRMFIHRKGAATRFMLNTYTGKDGAKGACKDPRDCTAYHALSEAEYLGGEALTVRAGMNRKGKRK